MPSPLHELPRWEHFAHEADIGIRGVGHTREEAFEQAARALTAVVASVDRVEPQSPVAVVCTAPSDDFLLLEWLNALVYEMATRRTLFSRFTVRIDGLKLVAEAWGETVDVDRHQPAVEVKGATLTGLHVARRADGTWVAECVVDV
jgi:tRNA nucleotidyltransferase (CCA-adding enzyme)